MNDTTPPQEPSAEAEQAAPLPQKTRGRWLLTLFTILAVVLAIAAAAGSYLTWRAFTDVQQLSNLRSAATEQQITALREDNQHLKQDISEQVTARLKALQDEQRTLQTSLAALHAQLRRQGASQAVAEAEYLVRIANHRLALERDLPGALQALGLADQRLQESSDPAASEIRVKLKEDLDNLLAVKMPDLGKLARTLANMSEEVTDLPLSGRQSAGATSAPAKSEPRGWREALSKLWDDINGLIVIRHGIKESSPLLSPNEEFILRQNLRLEFATARFALLQGNTRIFRDVLRSLRAMLTTNFDVEAEAVKSMLTRITELEQTELQPYLPPISLSLQLLQAHIRRDSAPVEDEPQHNNASQPGAAEVITP
jgi:uroporphyrin-3 C-methyltransferase